MGHLAMRDAVALFADSGQPRERRRDGRGRECPRRNDAETWCDFADEWRKSLLRRGLSHRSLPGMRGARGAFRLVRRGLQARNSVASGCQFDGDATVRRTLLAAEKK